MDKVKKYEKDIKEEGIVLELFCEDCEKLNRLEFPKGTIHTIFNDVSVLCNNCGKIFSKEKFLVLKDEIMLKAKDISSTDELEKLNNLHMKEVFIEKEILLKLNSTKWRRIYVINKILKDEIEKGTHNKILMDELLNGDKQ